MDLLLAAPSPFDIDAGRIPLRAPAERRNLPIGAAVDMAALAESEAYAVTLAREFDTCVAENAFKPAAVWKGPHSYAFDETDRLARFAQENAMTLRGHTLIWHDSIPRWLSEGGYTQREVRDMLRSYIHAIVGRYRGIVTVWDVVNEGVSEQPADALFRDTFWLRILGPDYIRLAFTWAHEADPGARLYYNDYEAEDMGPKANVVHDLLRILIDLGTPIHGLGLQYHLINGWRATNDHRRNIRRTVDLGLEWQVTECDVRIHLDGHPPSESAIALQASAYADVIGLCLGEPGCRGLLTWGFTDRHSWIPNFRKGWGAATLLDADYRPKPAYAALHDALASRDRAK